MYSKILYKCLTHFAHTECENYYAITKVLLHRREATISYHHGSAVQLSNTCRCRLKQPLVWRFNHFFHHGFKSCFKID